jgi:hypothetical protein
MTGVERVTSAMSVAGKAMQQQSVFGDIKGMVRAFQIKLWRP